MFDASINILWAPFLILKNGTRFWLKFGASLRHEIFIEAKCSVLYDEEFKS